MKSPSNINLTPFSPFMMASNAELHCNHIVQCIKKKSEATNLYLAITAQANGNFLNSPQISRYKTRWQYLHCSECQKDMFMYFNYSMYIFEPLNKYRGDWQKCALTIEWCAKILQYIQ